MPRPPFFSKTKGGLLDASANGTLRQRSPDTFRTFLQAQTEGGPVETLEIPADAIIAQYHHLGLEPGRADDPLAAKIPGWNDRLREAEQIGGNIRISTADYAAHLAGTDLDAALRRDIAPEGGYSMRDRDAAIADIRARYEEELAARGLDRWHIGKPGRRRLFRQDGRSLEEAATAAAENGFLPEVKRALDAGEKIDLEKALLAALDRDREGDGVRSELLGRSEAADRTRALQELQRALDEEGIDLKRETDNVAVKQALEGRWKAGAEDREGRSFGQPVNEGGNLDREMPVVEVPRVAAENSVAERKAAKAAREGRAPVDLENPDLPGVQIHLSAGDWKHAVASWGKSVTDIGESGAALAHLDAVRLLPELFRKSALVESHADRKGDANVTQVHRFFAAMSHEGERYAVKMTVEEHPAGSQVLVIDGIERLEKLHDMHLAKKLPAEGAREEPVRALRPDQQTTTPFPERAGPVIDIGNPIILRDLIRGIKGEDDTVYLQRSSAPVKRGSIQFFQALGDRIDAIINLFKANASTFPHESAHLWLEELIRDGLDPEAPQMFRDHLAATLKWMGVERPEEIGAEQHEKFARAFEAYLMEGRPGCSACGMGMT